ncbi:MAG TPA: putative LPS assembly protein LptD, partial [Longimicrobiaceae bacterium]
MRRSLGRPLAGALPLAAAIASFLAARHGEALAPALPLSAAPDTGRVRAPGGDTIPPGARALPGRPLPGDTARGRAPGDTARPAAPQEPDAVYDALLKLEGYVPVEYKGKEAAFRADSGVLELRGDAEVLRAGQRLTADTIVYDERSKIASAFGDPKVTGGGQDVEGNTLIYDLERRVATVRGGRTQYASGATWYINGETVAALQDSNRVYVERSTFTTDERPDPQYHFEAGKVKVIKDRLLVGRPAVLYFRNVPVAWLPFIVQDMEKGRRSGILTPRFGINDLVRTSSGYQRRISDVGYYWAINPYLGAQVSGEWQSNSHTAMQGVMDFNWRRQFLNGNVGWREFFKDEGGHDRTISGNASWRPNERTDINAQGSYASSSEFVRRRSVDPREATQDLSSSFSLSRRFDWGQMTLGSQRRQSLGNDRTEWTFPNFGITPNTVTLFRAPSPDQARWYNDVTLTFGAQGSRSGVGFDVDTVRGPDGILRAGQRPETRDNLQLSNSVRVGNLSLTNSASLNRNALEGLRGIDSVSSFNRDEGQWSSSISYQQNLVGSTFIAPNLSVSQQLKRDTLSRALGRSGYVSAPTRVNFGASLNTDLFGFFPGVGPIERIRHHVRPGISYSYSPRIVQNAFQDSVFGRANAMAQNRVSLTLDQTFEGKLRSATPRVALPSDSTADSTRAGSGTAPPAPPPDSRKVTLLAFNISALEYDFERAAGVDTIGGSPLGSRYGLLVPRSWKDGFTTDQISSSIRSDYLQGLNLQLSV